MKGYSEVNLLRVFTSSPVLFGGSLNNAMILIDGEKLFLIKLK